MFPLYLKRDDKFELPKEEFAFVAAQNGAFLKSETDVFRAVVRTHLLPMLKPMDEFAEYLLPPINAHLVMQIWNFFKRVYELHHTEAHLFIVWNTAQKTFGLVAGEQVVSSAHCRADKPLQTSDDLLFVGTVHSHRNMSAFHSGQDQRDEEHWDGVHLTIGRVNSERVDIVASLVVNGRRFSLTPERVLEGILYHEAKPGKTAPHQMPVELEYPEKKEGQKSQPSKRRMPVRKKRTSVIRYTYEAGEPAGYQITVPDGTPTELCEPDPAWFDRVHAETAHTIVSGPYALPVFIEPFDIEDFLEINQGREPLTDREPLDDPWKVMLNKETEDEP